MVLLVSSCIILCIDHAIIIHILRYFKQTSGQGCNMKLKEIPKSLGIVMLIRQDPPLTNALLQDIVFILEKIYFLKKQETECTFLIHCLR